MRAQEARLRPRRVIITNVRMLCLLIALGATVWGAQPRVTAHDVVTMVYTSLYSDHDDARLAQQLKKIRLKERLDASLISYFRNLHAGPQTLQALESLHERSEGLPAPAASPEQIQPIPGPDEEARILERLFQYAQSYVHGLPNFECDQVTRRFTNFDPIAVSYRKTLRHSDTFTRSLRFVNGVEDMQLKQVNGKNSQTWKAREGQSISSGEFGRDMLITFGNQVEPKMAWNHWEMWNGKRKAVFSYFASARKTKFTLMYCCYTGENGKQMQQTYNASVSGLVYVDPDTGVISRLILQAANLPAVFRLKESSTIIDYGPVSLGGQSYTMPVSALVFVRSDQQINRNEIAFVKYRKFGAESVLTFTDPKVVGYGSTPHK